MKVYEKPYRDVQETQVRKKLSLVNWMHFSSTTTLPSQLEFVGKARLVGRFEESRPHPAMHFASGVDDFQGEVEGSHATENRSSMRARVVTVGTVESEGQPENPLPQRSQRGRKVREEKPLNYFASFAGVLCVLCG